MPACGPSTPRRRPTREKAPQWAEFRQFNEWHFEHSLDWHLLEQERHQQLHGFFQSANQFYLAHPELWELDFSWEGFQWICADDNQGNCAAFLRKDKGTLLVYPVESLPSTGRATVWASPARAGTRWPSTPTTPPSAEPVWVIWSPKSEYIPCHGLEQSISVDALTGRRPTCVYKEIPAPPQKGGAFASRKAGGQASGPQKSPCRGGPLRPGGQAPPARSPHASSRAVKSSTYAEELESEHCLSLRSGTPSS